MAKKIVAVVVLLLGVAALMFALRSCASDSGGDGPSAEPSATPSATPSLAPVKMATTRISDAIKTRLDEVAGRPTRIECPKRVAQKIGTEFECDVFFEDEPDGTAAAAVAEVEIDGPDGHFTWTSTPAGQE